MVLTDFQKNANEKHFEKCLKMIKEGGVYIWKDEFEVFNVNNRKFNIDHNQAKKVIQLVTPKWFKENVIVDNKFENNPKFDFVVADFT
jgi:hypothetical protein